MARQKVRTQTVRMSGRLAKRKLQKAQRTDGSQKVSIAEKFNTRKVSWKTPGRRELYSLFPGIFFAIRRTI